MKHWFLMSMSFDIMKTNVIYSTFSKAFYEGNDKLHAYSLHQKAFLAK